MSRVEKAYPELLIDVDTGLPGIDDAGLDRLLHGDAIELAAPLPVDISERLAGAGLLVSDQRVSLVRAVAALDVERIRAGLTSSAAQLWPRVQLLNRVASTNAELMGLGLGAAGQALTTEYQSGGRGRRGRSWLSPVGRNLAVSVGWQLEGGLSRFAGLSLVTGLATVDALRTLGLSEVWLKWPNDILVESPADDEAPAAPEFAKLGGILVELQQHAGQSVAVIGIGLNHGGAELTRPAVDQPLGDIVELNRALSRTTVLITLLNTLADYLLQFARVGFGPMMSVWESLHAYAEREVVVLRGSERIVGQVLGVTKIGELRVATEAGEQRLDAGEVSLRMADA